MKAQISKLALPSMLLAGMLSGKTGAVVIETVPVGDPGIVADTTGFGSVAYTYDIGK